MLIVPRIGYPDAHAGIIDQVLSFGLVPVRFGQDHHKLPGLHRIGAKRQNS
jgi:hypothetical protein